MYRFLDRMPSTLDEHHHFLIGAMRQWTAAARAGRCPCAALAPGFAWRGVGSALADFAKAMAVLDTQAERWMRFGAAGGGLVSDDEAALLTLFSAAIDGDAIAVRRIAATLVAQDGAERLATSAEWVALCFVQSPMAQRDGR